MVVTSPLECTRGRSTVEDRSFAAQSHARATLAAHGVDLGDVWTNGEVVARPDEALATALMDLFRSTGSNEVFEALAALVRPILEAAARSRLRHSHGLIDPEEIVQDVLVNVYRYPDRFVASRPGAFRAWSNTILDNAIRRRMRPSRSALELTYCGNDLLCESADERLRPPVEQVLSDESSRDASRAYALLLACYLWAFDGLADRERYVLQQVEVFGRRYLDLGEEFGMRPEAVKMIVFRARRRIQDRLTILFSRAGIAPSFPLRDAG